MHSFACSSSNIHRPHSWKAGSKPPRLFHYTKPSAAHPDHQRRILVTASTQENDTQREVDDNAADSAPPNMLPSRPQKSRRQADSTDWVSSQLTRRFGCVDASTTIYQTNCIYCCMLLIMVVPSHAALPEDWSGSASWPLE